MSSNEGHTRAPTAGRTRDPARRRSPRARGVAPTVTIAAALTIAMALTGAPAASAEGTQASPRPSPQQGAYAQGEVVVKYAARTSAGAWAVSARAARAEDPAVVGEHTRLLKLARGVSVADALKALRKQKDVAWATPDYRARAAGGLIPNDTGIPGMGGAPGDWQLAQWNFVGRFGVDAPEAWGNVAAEGAPGGKGVIVAVLDTGVAYANRGRYRKSPEFSRYGFVKGI